MFDQALKYVMVLPEPKCTLFPDRPDGVCSRGQNVAWNSPGSVLIIMLWRWLNWKADTCPRTLRKKLPRRVPGVRLGRLAVDRHFQGKGLGELLLVDALTRAQQVYKDAGGMGLFIDAIDEQAAGYYKRFGFAEALDNPHLLFFPAWDSGI